ncbi:uncharacterized protein K444DRAFT_606308 [Hyaloscypha bicolor E]|uniref:Extracellular membrane protein CFEM domain-containing protein n=1 Tax=Hyaloscypha bicolor E TaxID=1095630 RepID=A0A2J6TWI9_9HELO|nr:uncharacterized protein K444DRAFT_606308 [Hyaloscypha bicolor E]PMD67365.1 hypothetical protein K444DRAFT_606308 [Hyaloscypha bicolor E]
MAPITRLSLAISRLLLSYFSSLPKTHADGTVSLQLAPAFSSVRPCVQNCIDGDGFGGCCAGVLGLIGCNNLDSCFCRTDFESSVSSILTSCINVQCNTHEIDLSAGVSLYNGYCGIDGATLNNYPTSSSANQVAGTTTLPVSPGSTPTVVVVSTATSTSGSSTLATSMSEWPIKMMVVPVLAALVLSRANLLCT